LTSILALLSGVPALVYQVAWTREIGLLAGGQVEAISVVLVAFFGGLTLGARWLGPRADRAPSPLALYGRLEAAAGALAILSPTLLRALPDQIGSHAALLGASALVLLPVTFLLGGTLPALLRASAERVRDAPRNAGWITGANTAGSVAGVGLAVWMLPVVGLRATLVAAGCASLAIGASAWALSRGRRRPELETALATGAVSVAGSRLALAIAGLAGASTLAFEVLVARMATLVLGSSLHAWGAVLALVLVGLALGNLASARLAAGTSRPAAALGWIEAAAAASVLLGARVLAPDLTTPSAGLGASTLVRVLLAVLPAALFMGAAFPFFVRLALAERIGAVFGAVSAANTAGGIAGALLAPFALLPAFGLVGGAVACASVNGLLGCGLLARAAPGGARRRVAAAVAAVALAALAARTLAAPGGADALRILHVEDGRQASVVVLHAGDRRDLVVDGDSEASSGGSGRRTEELLAVLPLAIHPDPRSLLEVGFGSGITLATASRFPLERVEAVEIAAAVLGAARFFEPENRGVGTDPPEGVRIHHADGRVHLARHPGSFDVVVANTLHPWSVGATGLYSREYFGRVAAALRPGGLAVQWVPLERIGGESLAAILRTFFAVFPYGGLWWGHGNLVALGSSDPLPPLDPARIAARLAGAGIRPSDLGWRDARELADRRIARAGQVRAALGDAPLLLDDRPLLEAWAAQRRGGEGASPPTGVVLDIARTAASEEPSLGSMLLWIESRDARARGDDARAARLAALAEAEGLEIARQERLAELRTEARQALRAGRAGDARALFRAAADESDPEGYARVALAAMDFEAGDLAQSEAQLRDVLRDWPLHAQAWNLLGVVLRQGGDRAAAREAFERALAADPYLAEALGNAGLLAVEVGDLEAAARVLERLRATRPLATPPEARALAAAIERAKG